MIAYLVTTAVFWFVLVVILSAMPFAGFVFDSADKDMLICTTILSFISIIAFTLPLTIYMVFIKTHYKKVIEYGTPEWKRLMHDK